MAQLAPSSHRVWKRERLYRLPEDMGRQHKGDSDKDRKRQIAEHTDHLAATAQTAMGRVTTTPRAYAPENGFESRSAVAGAFLKGQKNG
jgi:hypothetical protein